MTSLLDEIVRVVERVVDRALARRVPGLVVAKVESLTDNGCRLTYLSLHVRGASAEARIATSFAGDGYGAYTRPSPGEQVVVAFEGGDLSQPIVVGAVWRPADARPDGVDASNDNTTRVWQSPKAHRIALLDDGDVRGVEIRSASGHVVRLDDKSRRVLIETNDGLVAELDDGRRAVTITAGAEIKLSAERIILDGTTSVEISAQSVDVSGTLGVSVSLDSGAAFDLQPGTVRMGNGIAASVQMMGPLTTVDGIVVKTHMHPGTAPPMGGPFVTLTPL